MCHTWARLPFQDLHRSIGGGDIDQRAAAADGAVELVLAVSAGISAPQIEVARYRTARGGGLNPSGRRLGEAHNDAGIAAGGAHVGKLRALELQLDVAVRSAGFHWSVSQGIDQARVDAAVGRAGVEVSVAHLSPDSPVAGVHAGVAFQAVDLDAAVGGARV